MSVFVSTTFMADQSSVMDALNLLAEKGIFNIELGSIHQPESNLETNLKNTNYDFNYLIHNFFPPSKERFILNIASANEYIRNQSLKFVKNSIDFAEKIKADIYTMHPGFLIDPIKEGNSSKSYDFDFEIKQSSIFRSRDKSLEIFLNSLNEISTYISTKKITIAVETQGSVSRNDFMLFSKPDDFSTFFGENKNSKIGINLNLGHLNLSANVSGFDKCKLVEMLKSRIVAVEVSHNEGVEDDHQVLKADGWYMEVLKDSFFKKVPVIFEGRNLPVSEVVDSYNLLSDVLE